MKYDGKTFMLHSFMYKGHRARICTSCVIFGQYKRILLVFGN